MLISGYVSIVTGRSRATEYVDLLIPKMEFDRFNLLFNDLLSKEYECANTSISKDAFSMLDEHAIRFFKSGAPIPNIEFKIISNDIQKYSFENRIILFLKEKTLFLSPLEVQIAYKLSLVAKGDFEEISSDKDFEDAQHLYNLFKTKLNKEKISYFISYFGVENLWRILENEGK